jgi:ribose transport system substrate-binding protein
MKRPSNGRRRYGGWNPRYGLLLLAVLVAAVVAAGCGSSSSSSSSETTSEAAATANPKVANKTIGFVDILGASAVEKRFYDAFTYAAQQAGWNVQFVDGEGKPSKILGATQNFVNSGVDAIVFNSVPAEYVKPAVKQAKAKGIPTINLVTPATPGTFEGDYDENEAVVTKPLAEKLKEDFPEGGKIGLLESQQISASRERVAALKQDLEGSSVEVVADGEVPFGSSASAAGKVTTDMLNANPEIEAVVGIFDQYSPAALAALKTSQASEVKFYSYYADSVNVPLMKRPGSPFVAVADSDIAKVGFYAVDQLLNHFATGAPVAGASKIQITPLIVTKENLPTGEPDEGPVPFKQLGEPYVAKWSAKYGIEPGE